MEEMKEEGFLHVLFQHKDQGIIMKLAGCRLQVQSKQEDTVPCVMYN